MWKIVVVLVLTALGILMARLAYDAPRLDLRLGTAVGASAPVLTPPLMYAGVRG